MVVPSTKYGLPATRKLTTDDAVFGVNKLTALAWFQTCPSALGA